MRTPFTLKLMNLLSHKQRQFAEAVANGATYTDAYRTIYSDRGKPSTARSEGSRLANNPKVARAIRQLQEPVLETLKEAQLAVLQELTAQFKYGNARERERAGKTLVDISRLL
ncbi:MAG: terminase small subunit [Bryobacteraceae bacterium]